MREDKGLPRRAFLGGCAILATAAAAGCGGDGERRAPSPSGDDEPSPEQWWIDRAYVRHRTVDASRLAGEGVVRARIDGRWVDVRVVALPDRFVQWSFDERIARLGDLAERGFDPRDLDGPHNACVATYGGWTRDSSFSLNTAYKGMGFVPVASRLAETIEELGRARRRLEAARGGLMEAMKRKTEHLARLYSDRDRFDRTAQVSLELITEPDHATHTFLNMMANPIASLSFLAYPTFEIRAVPRLLHPDDPELGEHERRVVEYTNAVHGFVHGGQKRYITCVYHVAEVYDDTPATRGGVRIA